MIDDEPHEEVVQPRLDHLLVLEQQLPFGGGGLREQEAALEDAHEHPPHVGVERAAIAGEEGVGVVLHRDGGDEAGSSVSSARDGASMSVIGILLFSGISGSHGSEGEAPRGAVGPHGLDDRDLLGLGQTPAVHDLEQTDEVDGAPRVGIRPRERLREIEAGAQTGDVRLEFGS